jgi:glutathione peroxidase
LTTASPLPTKYLIGRDGHIAAVFSTQVEPTDPKVIAAIEKELK